MRLSETDTRPKQPNVQYRLFLLPRRHEWKRRRKLPCRILRGSSHASRAIRCAASGPPGEAGVGMEWILPFIPSGCSPLDPTDGRGEEFPPLPPILAITADC